tara:strand:+ start:10502 stop:10816 length:315 start_codon:yes stop_codon:yes gene_type:complete
MDQEAVDTAFADWASRNQDIVDDIYDELRETSHLLDVEDSNHAKWHEDDLGVLIVLPYAHAVAFAVESMDGEFENSPIHSFVFSTITQLIVNAVGTIDDFDEFD